MRLVLRVDKKSRSRTERTQLALGFSGRGGPTYAAVPTRWILVLYLTDQHRYLVRYFSTGHSIYLMAVGIWPEEELVRKTNEGEQCRLMPLALSPSD